MQSYESFGILFSVMSEQSYLKAPSSANARVDIAGVEGSLEYIAGNIGTEWCTLDDIKGIIDEARKTLDGARRGVAGRGRRGAPCRKSWKNF